MAERCDFCKRGPLYNRYLSFKKGMKPPPEDMYESLDFKDTALSDYGDAAIICKSCAEDLKKVLDKFWDDKTPDYYKCGCLQHELSFQYNVMRARIETRPEYQKNNFWLDLNKRHHDAVINCKKPEHKNFLIWFQTGDNFAKLVKEQNEPWESNFQDNEELDDEDYDEIVEDED